MSHFLYPSQLLVRLPHLDRLFENLLERQTLHEELERTINGSNSNNSITTQASGDVHNDKYSNNNQNTSSEYKCWICWDIIDTSKEQWIRPCKCSLVSHQQCLLSWIIENQRLSPRKKVYCPQCSSLYVLAQNDSFPLAVMNLTRSGLHHVTPYLSFLGLGCSILITSTSFGIFTLFTLFGKDEGERIMGDSKHWSWKTWLGLPAIPAFLIGSRFSNLDIFFPFISTLVLRLSGSSQKAIWPPSPAILFGALSCVRLIYNHIHRKIQYKLTLERTSQENNGADPYLDSLERHGADGIDGIIHPPADTNLDPVISEIMREKPSDDICFTVVGALLWPTISNIIGGYLSYSKLIRKYLPEPFQRNVFGGCLFVIAKDALNLYHQYERLQQYRSRKVVSYK